MKRLWMLLTLLLALALTGVAVAETAPANAPAQEGAPAPDFTLQTLDGGHFTLSEQKGKAVYLNLWATWCPPCVMEIPDIQKLHDRYGDKLSIIGVSVDRGVDEVRAFVEENKLTYAIAMDQNYLLTSELYPTDSIPLSVFIDPEGVVTYIHLGMLPYEAMEELVELALGEQ